jgi:peptidoglycan/LPS O-acetylase OafA/YrhL
LAFVALAVAGLATAWAWYLAFATGGLFYTLGANRLRLPLWGGPLLLLAGLTLGGMGLSEAAVSPVTLLAALLRALHLPDGEAQFLIHTIAAGLLVAGLMATGSARALLSSAIPQWLGHTSFGLYIIHGPILDFFMRWLAKQVQPASWDMIWFFALFAGLSLSGGWLMTVVADEPTLRLLKHIKLPASWRRRVAQA